MKTGPGRDCGPLLLKAAWRQLAFCLSAFFPINGEVTCVKC
jgi:hypothetical protein